MKSDQNI